MTNYYSRRVVERAIPAVILIAFFSCLGVLFLSLPTNKKLQNSSPQMPSLTTDQNWMAIEIGTEVAENIAADVSVANDLMDYYGIPEKPPYAAVESKSVETIASSPGDCRPPILKPDGSTLPEIFMPPKTCLEKYGQNPAAIQILEIRDPSEPSRTINQSFIVPTLSAVDVVCSYAEVISLDDFQIQFQQPKSLGKLPVACPVAVFQLNCSTAKDVGDFKNFSSIFRCMIPAKPTKIKQMNDNNSKFNIIMIGLDSLSRVTWLDQLPRSINYFSDELNAITLEGYNIVGDGTTVNLLALLTGHLYEELHEARRSFPNSSVLDDFPFLWKQLREESGYVTLYDEDQPTIGTFQHRMMGFRDPPVDYYGRPFQLAVKEQYQRVYDCLGSLPTFEEMLNQVENLFKIHPDPQPKFAFIFNGAHSRPTFDGTQDVTHLDELLLSSLKNMKTKGYLDNTILILFSDHGARNGKNRATARGKIEERMPLMSLSFPKRFLTENYQSVSNFKEAVTKTTTPFDMHVTLQNVAGVQELKNRDKRALNLFQPIPKYRTCEAAGLLPHWCSCGLGNPEQGVSADLKLVNGISTEIFYKVFEQFTIELLKPVRELCEPIQPHSLFMISRISDRYVQLSFYTKPGNGQWEVTFANNETNSVSVADSSQVSRTNSYGPAPFCIRETHPHLREYCYCKAFDSLKKRVHD